MNVLATAAQMRELDCIAIGEWGSSSPELMENAARAVTEQVLRVLRERSGFVSCPIYAQGQKPEQPQTECTSPTVVIFCGPGNNGGDGVAVARQLLEQGVEVEAILVGERSKMTPDERVMEEKLNEVHGRLKTFIEFKTEEKKLRYRCGCVVDALFGVGLCREVTGDFARAIAWMELCPAPTISCDIPSGVSADTGEILGTAVRAARTVTFTCAKPGLYLGEGGPCAGEVLVADIGIPCPLVNELIWRQEPRTMVLERGHYVLPRRKRTAHKGDFGRVFILAGSEGYTGAPVLAARAAVRSGAGLVFLGVPREIYPIAAVKCDEAMPFPLPEDYDQILEKARGCDAALIGPGLGRSEGAECLALALLRDLDIPVVLDADGINALAGHIDILDGRRAMTVLTPHDGEFRRLTGCELPISDRLTQAKDFAAAHGCVMILKGHNTITALPDGRAYLNANGNPGMAKGGCGDVLAGLIVGLLGQKQLCTDGELCALAVYYHGEAGDRCAARLGEYGMTPSDMLEELPLVLKDHTNTH